MTQQRRQWIGMLEKVAGPVLGALARRELRAVMPVEQRERAGREKVTHLEALGRTLAGAGPWLQLEGGEPEEQAARQRMFDDAVQAIDAATADDSPDKMNFTDGGQPLVDAAFLAQGLLHCPRLWGALSGAVRGRLVEAMRSTRVIKPGFNNWLLFSAEVEAWLARIGEGYDTMRVDYALQQHEQWYVGDGAYGDGPRYHHDYYNSFVIQPMLLDVLDELGETNRAWGEMRTRAIARAQRYAVVQERMIAPDGSFPVIGRSMAYRCGAFALLAQMAWQHRLGDGLALALKPAQVRCALGAVIGRTLGAAGTFDERGFLRIGLAGHQPGLGEGYISTGSLYLCTLAFAPLGLAEGDAFWGDADEPWSMVKIWGGGDAPSDHAMDEH